MLKQAQEVLVWFDRMRNPAPTWYLADFYIQTVDNVPYKLKTPFDMSFIRHYGKVFKVYDDQDSGNICFGVQNDGKRYFIKFAGAPTEHYAGKPEDAVARLKATVPVYLDLAHPNLNKFIKAEEIGAFALFSDYKRTFDKWPLSKDLYQVALKAVSDERGRRQRSIRQFIAEWNNAKKYGERCFADGRDGLCNGGL